MVERYDLDVTEYNEPTMTLQPMGGYVLYTDYKLLEVKYAQLKKRIEELDECE